MADLVSVAPLDDNTFWRVTFGGSKGNILDRRTLGALRREFENARTTRSLKGISLEGAGAHFSFGASVEEHLPKDVAGMLADLRELLFAMLDSAVVLAAAVRGQCLGGGLELASVCHRVLAGADAKLGQPEIALGVFAPVASVILPVRIGRAHAEDLCLTGRVISATEAREMGLVDEVTPGDPAEAALTWLRTHFGARSASSVRLAVRAVRREFAERLRAELPALEALYLNELMATSDAVEGLHAFLEKRQPAWRHA
jgi:cyclohexa-1,5-dienecarbonyl-CoA hydratase